jgi:hypothetical protein
MVKIISYRYGICFGQNYELKQYWNVFWSKFYHATCLERDVVKMASVHNRKTAEIWGEIKRKKHF